MRFLFELKVLKSLLLTLFCLTSLPVTGGAILSIPYDFKIADNEEAIHLAALLDQRGGVPPSKDQGDYDFKSVQRVRRIVQEIAARTKESSDIPQSNIFSLPLYLKEKAFQFEKKGKVLRVTIRLDPRPAMVELGHQAELKLIYPTLMEALKVPAADERAKALSVVKKRYQFFRRLQVSERVARLDAAVAQARAKKLAEAQPLHLAQQMSLFKSLSSDPVCISAE